MDDAMNAYGPLALILLGASLIALGAWPWGRRELAIKNRIAYEDYKDLRFRPDSRYRSPLLPRNKDGRKNRRRKGRRDKGL